MEVLILISYLLSRLHQFYSNSNNLHIYKIFLHHSDANFLLVEVDDAQATYDYLVDKGIIVRNRNSVRLCEGCLRITIGTKTENQELLAALRTM